MGIKSFNKNQSKFINNEKFEKFYTLEELYNNTLEEVKGLGINYNGRTLYKITGVYTYKSSYGNSAFIKSTGFNISLPQHLYNDMEELRTDEESINEINEGVAYVEVYTYSLEKYPNKKFYSINFELIKGQ